ncbi:hypothetical protein [Actinomyces bovis]|uniref:hypothetical protein n=1 Tax=Actinomyces bovis TaxID=1658 RepID=UPI000F81C8CB|nr:hypothetical protein [Actinomyces bovis]
MVDGSPGVVGQVGVSSQEVDVHPVCWWYRGFDGAQMAQWIESGALDALNADGTTRSDTDEVFAGWASHRDDTGGYWWHAMCSQTYFTGTEQEYQAYVRSFEAGGTHRFLPEGQTPPVAPLPGKVVAQAVRRAMHMPSPQVSTSPKLGANGATVVGLDTWVWATEATVRSASVNASVGSTSVSVQVTASGLHLSAPDAASSCTGWGSPWVPGVSVEGGSDCTVRFTRSSAHLGGTTPLKIGISYKVSWSSNDGSSGELDNIETTNTMNLPVAEIQTINIPTN